MSEAEANSEMRGCLIGVLFMAIVAMVMCFALQGEVDKLRYEKKLHDVVCPIGSK